MGMTEQECQEKYCMSLVELWNQSMSALEDLQKDGEFLDIKVDYVK